MLLWRWGLCPVADADDQLCVLEAGHSGPHRDSGLRAMLEATADDIVLRVYTAPGANEKLAMEAQIFRVFGFVPVARNETWVRTGPDAASIALAGVLATIDVTRTLILSVVFRHDPSAPRRPALPSAGESAEPG